MFMTAPEPRGGAAGLVAQGIGGPLGGLLGQESQRALTSSRLQGLMDKGLSEKSPIDQLMALYSALPQTPQNAQLIGDLAPALMRQRGLKAIGRATDTGSGSLQGQEAPFLTGDPGVRSAPQAQGGYVDELMGGQQQQQPVAQQQQVGQPVAQQQQADQSVPMQTAYSTGREEPTPWKNANIAKRSGRSPQPIDFMRDVGQMDPQALAQAPMDPVLEYAVDAGIDPQQMAPLLSAVKEGRMSPLDYQQRVFDLAKERVLTNRSLSDDDRNFLDQRLNESGIDDDYYRNLAQEQMALSDAPNKTARWSGVRKTLKKLRNTEARYVDAMSKPAVRGDYQKTFNDAEKLMQDYKKQVPFHDRESYEHMMTLGMNSNWEPYEVAAQVHPQGRWMGSVADAVKDFPKAAFPGEPGADPSDPKFDLTDRQVAKRDKMWDEAKPKIAKMWAKKASNTDSPLVLRKLLNQAGGVTEEMFNDLWEEISLIKDPSPFQESDSQHLNYRVTPSLWEILKGKRAASSAFRQYQFDKKLLLKGEK